jgi:glucose-6-phosphate isomerase
VNTGNEPLVYWGVYPCEAGHDYTYVKNHNFSHVVVEVDGKPAVLDRSAHLKAIAQTSQKGAA